jgi:hypothetical protein
MAKRNSPKAPKENVVEVADGMVALGDAPPAASPEPDVIEESSEYDSVAVIGSIPAAPKVTKYWLGTLKNCPFYNVVAGGEDFPRITEDLPEDPLDTSRYPRPGKMRELTDDQVRRIVKQMGERVIRILASNKDGSITRAQILDTTCPTYRKEPFDQPMAAFCYMVRVAERMPTDWREKEPPAMLRPA